MATRAQFRWLFHLPSALRCRMVLPLETCTPEARSFQRAFAHTTRAFAQQAKPPPPRPSPSLPGKQHPARPAPKPRTATAPPSRPASLEADLGRLLHESGRVLLYRAPSHASFFISSYFFGLTIIGGAVVHASFTADDKRIPWYSRLVTSTLAIFLAIVGTALVLAPSKLIRSVSLVRNNVTNVQFLSFQTKSALLPFVSSSSGGNTINAPLGKVHIDRAIQGDALPPYSSIPIQDAEKFTQFYADSANAPTPSMFERLRRFNRSLLHAWPNLWWDTRRMFLRDGLVYVQIPGHGHWKLDLRNAELLENGRPLTATMISSSLDRSLAGWLRTAVGR